MLGAKEIKERKDKGRKGKQEEKKGKDKKKMLFHLCSLAPLEALLQHVYLQLCLSLHFLSPLSLKLSQRWKPNISSRLSSEYIKPWACAWLSGNRGFFCICRSLSKHLFPYVAHSQTLPSQGVWFDTCTISCPLS